MPIAMLALLHATAQANLSQLSIAQKYQPYADILLKPNNDYVQTIF
ncbi:hypothetical protein [Herpetosiphon giganteus]|nr:hypothetical protein [Herpetosiphon giganteus]MBM7841728.1 hypothetical protein [Herpetosiphon giganteus]